MHASNDPGDLVAGSWLDGWLVAVRGVRQNLTSRAGQTQRSGDASWVETVILELDDEMEDQIKAMTSHPETAFGDSSPALWRAGRREGLSSALQVFRRRLEESQRGDEPLDDQLTVDLLHRLVAEMTAAVMQADQPSLF